MRILHTVELYEPSVGGAQEVVRQLSTRLAARGHEVTVATSALPDRRSREIDGVKIAQFEVGGNAVRGLTGDVDAYRRFVLEGEFDVMMSYAAQQWTMDALLPVLEQIPYAKAAAPCGFSALHDPAYADYFRELPDRLAQFDSLIFHSDVYRDIEFARAAGIEQLVVIPNAADEREFGDEARLDLGAVQLRARHAIAADTPLLLTVGGHTGEKGHGFAIEALRRLQVPRAALMIVGNNPLGLGCRYSCRLRALSTNLLTRGRKRVLLLSPPRADVLAAYRAADAFVFASAIECSPLVLFEAMAAGTPFVTLDAGNAREIADWSDGGGQVLPTRRRANGRVDGRPDDMALALARLLGDRAERARMGQAARSAWAREYTWEKVSRRYEQLYGRLAEQRRSAGAPAGP